VIGSAKTVLEVLLLGIVVYLFIRFLQQTRGGGVMRGFIMVVVVLVAVIGVTVNLLHLEHLGYLTERGITIFLTGIVVLFQPELRQALVKVGDYDWGSRWGSRRADRDPDARREVLQAAKRLARRRFGALIVLEGRTGLGGLIEGGTALDARVSAKLLHCIFFKDSPLHDGAVLIRKGRVAAAACVLPNSESPHLSDALGMRHRAALGIAEESDALVVVVSEETARFSVAFGGKLEVHVSAERLEEILLAPEPPARRASRISSGPLSPEHTPPPAPPEVQA
jgi:diadenylate cyclase